MAEYQTRILKIAEKLIEKLFPRLLCTIKRIKCEVLSAGFSASISPEEPVICSGSGVTYTVTSEGCFCDATYQWQVLDDQSDEPDWVDIPGANTDTFTTPPYYNIPQ